MLRKKKKKKKFGIVIKTIFYLLDHSRRVDFVDIGTENSLTAVTWPSSVDQRHTDGIQANSGCIGNSVSGGFGSLTSLSRIGVDGRRKQH